MDDQIFLLPYDNRYSNICVLWLVLILLLLLSLLSQNRWALSRQQAPLITLLPALTNPLPFLISALVDVVANDVQYWACVS